MVVVDNVASISIKLLTHSFCSVPCGNSCHDDATFRPLNRLSASEWDVSKQYNTSMHLCLGEPIAAIMAFHGCLLVLKQWSI